MEIKRIGTQPSSLGPAANFTGHARRDPLYTASAPASLAAGSITFDAGARTVWHTHPLGQLLVITAGAGRVQAWAARSRRCAPATWSGSRPARSTGTAPAPPPA